MATSTKSTSTAKAPTKPRASRATSKPKAETPEVQEALQVASGAKVFKGLPSRQYNRVAPVKHLQFAADVVEANFDTTAKTPINERVFLDFPINSKGIASAINRGKYPAMPKGKFLAKNVTIDGVLHVLVTVRFPEDKQPA